MAIRKGKLVSLIVLLILLLLTACKATETTPKKSSSKSLIGQAAHSNLKLIVKVDKKTYKPKQSINVDMSLTNVSSKIIKFEFSSAKKFDLAAVNEKGEEAYRWSGDRAFAQVILPASLQPKESFKQKFNFSLSQKGKYEVKGETGTIFINQKPLTLKASPVEILIKD
ncbi:MAG: hypothetical protein E3J54_00465 [Actinobacteria bacterium]|nr:MAG: hypothetical protein E3J54_00465 [Actinomycetota bacterium]